MCVRLDYWYADCMHIAYSKLIYCDKRGLASYSKCVDYSEVTQRCGKLHECDI